LQERKFPGGYKETIKKPLEGKIAGYIQFDGSYRKEKVV